MKKGLAVLALCLPLGGCGHFDDVIDDVFRTMEFTRHGEPGRNSLALDQFLFNTLATEAHDVADLGSVRYTLVYPTDILRFDHADELAGLSWRGQESDLTVTELGAGRLAVTDRLRDPGEGVSGTFLLHGLTFDLRHEGSGEVRFEDVHLYDARGMEILGAEGFGGTVTVP